MVQTIEPATTRRNYLLAALPPSAYAALQPSLETVSLERKYVLAAANEPWTHVYFPTDAVMSVLVPMDDGSAVEAATVGLEGMLGLPLLLGDGIAQEEALVQIAGSALRLEAEAFRATVQRNAPLRDVLHRYTLAFIGQVCRTAGCNRSHGVDERCARWLLLTHDRVGRDEFPLTQEFLAAMLGVRRASVTVAAGMLQEAGLIEYRRGLVRITDRARLEEASCEDYRLTRAGYDRLFPSHPD